MSVDTLDHRKPDIHAGDHVHMAWWWLKREMFHDVNGRVVMLSPRGHYAYVASLEGVTYKVQVGNLVHSP
jgi:hypothetical protein